jgi:hypothetical protein
VHQALIAGTNCFIGGNNMRFCVGVGYMCVSIYIHTYSHTAVCYFNFLTYIQTMGYGKMIMNNESGMIYEKASTAHCKHIIE